MKEKSQFKIKPIINLNIIDTYKKECNKKRSVFVQFRLEFSYGLLREEFLLNLYLNFTIPKNAYRFLTNTKYNLKLSKKEKQTSANSVNMLARIQEDEHFIH
ncbi:hypothetical protein BpHYR1_039345 [Brachionus plicatilis]|uniref:Uncharacterized protein n=1 Tax=Brachionus plicatilis TaxID=10195 RepID=A0A3M7SUF3_BRAPC|nr:hypothetical protein BpHYR1_039345 [Brachionus plicatilis]